MIEWENGCMKIYQKLWSNSMRKIIVLSFITLDGVMQAPGGPEEDTSSSFKYGGWTAPYFAEADEAAGELMATNEVRRPSIG